MKPVLRHGAQAQAIGRQIQGAVLRLILPDVVALRASRVQE